MFQATLPIIRSSKTVIAAITAAGNQKHVKPETAITVFEFPMMGGVSRETC